jgi:hypothetical protein
MTKCAYLKRPLRRLKFLTDKHEIGSWDTWSDAEARAWLVKNKFVDKAKAEEARRDQLEKYLEENWNKASSNLQSSWKESDMRDVRLVSILLVFTRHMI